MLHNANSKRIPARIIVRIHRNAKIEIMNSINCLQTMVTNTLVLMMDCMGPISMANVEETARIILICIAWLMEMHEIDEVELESIKIITE